MPLNTYMKGAPTKYIAPLISAAKTPLYMLHKLDVPYLCQGCAPLKVLQIIKSEMIFRIRDYLCI